MITTIQISESAKNELEKLKESEKDTYEKVILSLIRFAEEQRRKKEELLIEGCKEMHDEMLKISKEFEGTLMDGLDKNEKWDF